MIMALVALPYLRCEQEPCAHMCTGGATARPLICKQIFAGVGNAAEDVEHLVVMCDQLSPPLAENITFPQALCFSPQPNEEAPVDPLTPEIVRTTNLRLTHWWGVVRRQHEPHK